MPDPIVMISSYPPRRCNLADFCAEAHEFIRKHNPDRDVLVISHTDGRGEGVFPIIDTRADRWWEPVAAKLNELNPDVVHVQYDHDLYRRPDGGGDDREAFLALLQALNHFPLIVEPHSIPAPLRDAEARFVYRMCTLADVVIFKCHYQKWRLDWTFPGMGLATPTNVMIVPHGVRPDRRFGVHEIPQLRRELGLDQSAGLADHLIGLIAPTKAGKRWDILLHLWPVIEEQIRQNTGRDWDLLVGEAAREAPPANDTTAGTDTPQNLERIGPAHAYAFKLRGEHWYRMMSVCDFIVLPVTDETRSEVLARIIALNKPFVTSAPMEGPTAQTLESGGGLLFTSDRMLADAVVRLACDEELRMRLGNQLKYYLDNIVSWDLVAGQYNAAYDLARSASLSGVAPHLTDLS